MTVKKTERDFQIAAERLRGKSCRELGEEFGISAQRVRQICHRCARRLEREARTFDESGAWYAGLTPAAASTLSEFFSSREQVIQAITMHRIYRKDDRWYLDTDDNYLQNFGDKNVRVILGWAGISYRSWAQTRRALPKRSEILEARVLLRRHGFEIRDKRLVRRYAPEEKHDSQ